MNFVKDVQHFSLDLSQLRYCFSPDMSGWRKYSLFANGHEANAQYIWTNKVLYNIDVADAFRNIIMCIYNDISRYAFAPLKHGERLAYGVSPVALGLRSEEQSGPELPFLREGNHTGSFKFGSVQSVIEELLNLSTDYDNEATALRPKINISIAKEWIFLKNTIRELARPKSEMLLKSRGELTFLTPEHWHYNAEFAWFGHGPTYRISRKKWIETINMSAADLIDRSYGKLCSATGEPLEKSNLALLFNLISPAHRDYQALPSFGGAVCATNSTEQYWLPPLLNYKECNQIGAANNDPNRSSSGIWVWLCLAFLVISVAFVYKRRSTHYGYHRVATATQTTEK